MHGLSLGFRVVLKNPGFVACNNVLKEVWIIFNVFQGVSTNSHPMFCLLRHEEFRYHLRTHVSHAKIFMQNLPDCFFIQI